jgi:sugar phosphate isomerase/epimerase
MMAPRRAGLCSVTFRALSCDEVIEIAVRAGLEGIEWGTDVHVPIGDHDHASEIARRCTEAGLASPSLGSYARAGARDADGITATLDTAAALGATNVRVWCDWVGARDADAQRRARIAADLRSWCTTARAYGLTLSLEYHRHTLTEDAASALRLLHDVDADADELFLYWQPVEGRTPAMWIDEVRAIRAHLSHLHVFRWGDDLTRHPLVEGADLWPAVLCAATDSRWRGDRWAFLEFVAGDRPDQLIDDATTLRRWLSNPGVESRQANQRVQATDAEGAAPDYRRSHCEPT